jgi:hypothetical protein
MEVMGGLKIEQMPAFTGRSGFAGNLAIDAARSRLWHGITMKTARFLLGLCLFSFLPLAVLADTTVGKALGALPVTINAPGKYRLTKGYILNGSGPAITITARDVVLDLNGFSIAGPASVDENNVAILVRGPNVLIRNGTIRKFDTAIADDGTEFNGTTVEDVVCVSQASTGIRLGADYSVVRRCIVRFTGQQEDRPDNIFGIHLSGHGTVEHCLVEPIRTRQISGLIAGLRLFRGAFVVRECDVHEVAGAGLSFNGDQGTVFDRVRIRECNTGLVVSGTGQPVLRHSVIRDCNNVSSGTFVDGGGNHP